MWVLRNADIVLTFFNGGFLQNTPYRWLELTILKLAGKAVVVSPYGSDIAVRGYLAGWEEAMEVDYPEVIARSDATRARVDWFSRHADVTVRNVNPGYVSRVDVLWPNQFALDPAEFSPGVKSSANGRNGRVTVLHAPNHRHLKGTLHLQRAVESCEAKVSTSSSSCSRVDQTARWARRFATPTSSPSSSSWDTGFWPSREWRVERP